MATSDQIGAADTTRHGSPTAFAGGTFGRHADHLLALAQRDEQRLAADRQAVARLVHQHAGDVAEEILDALGLAEGAEEADPLKRCPDCGTSKPHGDFGRAAARHDGLSTYCKSCVNARRARRSAKSGRPEVRRG